MVWICEFLPACNYALHHRTTGSNFFFLEDAINYSSHSYDSEYQIPKIRPTDCRRWLSPSVLPLSLNQVEHYIYPVEIPPLPVHLAEWFKFWTEKELPCNYELQRFLGVFCWPRFWQNGDRLANMKHRGQTEGEICSLDTRNPHVNVKLQNKLNFCSTSGSLEANPQFVNHL